MEVDPLPAHGTAIQTKRLPQGIMEARLGNMKVCVRASDRFFKVSMISKGRKDWSNWSKSEGTGTE